MTDTIDKNMGDVFYPSDHVNTNPKHTILRKEYCELAVRNAIRRYNGDLSLAVYRKLYQAAQDMYCDYDLQDIEDYLAWALEDCGSNGIETNGMPHPCTVLF